MLDEGGADEAAVALCREWSAGQLEELDARHRLWVLALDHPDFLRLVRHFSGVGRKYESEMQEEMANLLRVKICGVEPHRPPTLDLALIAQGGSLVHWMTALLSPAGRLIQGRIRRDERTAAHRLTKIASEAIAGNPRLVPTPRADEVVDEVPVPAELPPKATDQDLLLDGSIAAARAAAFRNAGSRYSGQRRTRLQAALLAQGLQVPQLPRMSMAQWPQRQEVLEWLRSGEAESALRRLVSDLVTASRRELGVPEPVRELFSGCARPELAALATREGYVLANMVDAAVAPAEPVPASVVRAMREVVQSAVGHSGAASRVVARWAGAHQEWTSSPAHASKVPARVKTWEEWQTDHDLLVAEVETLLARGVRALGATVSDVVTSLDRIYSELVWVDLDAVVERWVAPVGNAR